MTLLLAASQATVGARAHEDARAWQELLPSRAQPHSSSC